MFFLNRADSRSNRVTQSHQVGDLDNQATRSCTQRTFSIGCFSPILSCNPTNFFFALTVADQLQPVSSPSHLAHPSLPCWTLIRSFTHLPHPSPPSHIEHVRLLLGGCNRCFVHLPRASRCCYCFEINHCCIHTLNVYLIASHIPDAHSVTAADLGIRRCFPIFEVVSRCFAVLRSQIRRRCRFGVAVDTSHVFEVHLVSSVHLPTPNSSPPLLWGSLVAASIFEVHL
ncbi:hypothetical protein PDE_09676 [Penicillium oxalicum 114-2]|uniref:Uncharacterized protein n=1 Tax=Penicillium oxalicum (strain 114-2 / CGMCC 5302) TaxID=933388 RepID=S8BHM6_PENO1|nr:hypothetical protein PDE_09676 [Penicillium oxalicum 114-2]